jgi:DNA-binding response OmpR family regulator
MFYVTYFVQLRIALRVSDELSLVLQSVTGTPPDALYDGEHMRALMAIHTPNIVMLDLDVAKQKMAYSLCKWLRPVYPNLGIVMLTARVMGSERTEGYQAGADISEPTAPMKYWR